MLYRVFDAAELPALVSAFMDGYEVVAPVKRGAHYSFEAISSPDEMDLAYDTTLASPKRYFLPPTETLMRYNAATNEVRLTVHGRSSHAAHPDEAVERIEAAAKEAVAKAAQCVVPMPEHFHMEIDFVKHHVAYSKSFYPGATLKDDKFVCFDSDDWYEVLRFCHFVLSDG